MGAAPGRVWLVAIAPEERSYVGRDAAVRVLAAQLAEMAQSEAAAQHDETVIGQEARIANLLSASWKSKPARSRRRKSWFAPGTSWAAERAPARLRAFQKRALDIVRQHQYLTI